MIWLILAMTVQAGGDTLVMRDSTEGNAAELLYRNSAGQSSSLGDFTLEHNGITISVSIQFAPNSDAEMITVTIPDGQHVAIPEQIAVDDGDETVVQILRPLW